MKMKEEECTIEMILFEYSLKPRMLFQPYTRIVPSFFVMGCHFLLNTYTLSLFPAFLFHEGSVFAAIRLFAALGDGCGRFAFCRRITVENMEKCSSGCLNGGHCSPDTNACICPSNCEGVHCEVCHHSFPFSLIFGVLCSLGVLVYLVILVVDYVKRKCR